LKGTLHYKLIYSKSDNSELFQPYSDVSHGGCKQTSCSTGKYATVICRVVIGWSSKHQLFVILSSTEAEYVAVVEAEKEIKWIKNILTEFSYLPSYLSTLFIDNKSGIDMSKNPEHHRQMKHLDLCLY